MAKQIRGLWMRLGTIFLSLYFAPVTYLWGMLFGAGDARAGTVSCVGYGARECDGVASESLQPGERRRCVCGTNPPKSFDVWCSEYDPTGDGRPTYTLNATTCAAESCSTNGATRDCSTSSQYGTQTCSGGYWGTCQKGNCKAGYLKVSGSCYATCFIANGTGYLYEENEVEESSSSSSSSV